MANAHRALLILFEGLPGTVIESQVLVHAREMTRLGIADFEVWTVAWSDELYRRSVAAQSRAEELAGCPVRVLRGLRPAVPFSAIVNALVLLSGLIRFRPRFEIVHARTDYAAAVCRLLRPWGRFLLLWDCRGDSPAEFAERYRPRNPVLRAARAIRLRRLERDRRAAAHACDCAVFVSSTLESLAAPLLDGKPHRVIPCTASETLFNFDPALRAQARRELGADDDDRIYVFGGSLAPYQCFEETLDRFAAIRSADARARLLILTPALDDARRRIAARPEFDGVTLRSATIAEMNGYLNAADAAFMLREATATNRAAFPTKFAEYCLTGLAVVMSPAVPDAHALAQRLGNLLTVSKDGTVTWPTGYDRAQVASAARACLTRSSVASDYAELYAAATGRSANCLGGAG